MTHLEFKGSIVVSVIRSGREIRKIERPLRMHGSTRTVKYKGREWIVRRGNRIVVDAAPFDALSETSGPAAVAGSLGNPTGASSPVHSPPVASGRAPADMAYPAGTPGGAVHEIPINWDAKQRRVFEAPADRRLLVDAPPGTGKTAVACRRVAWLLDEAGVAPSKIWLISFTRTAVLEIRNRIAGYLRDGTDLWSIRIATLDSHAWAIQSGFNDDASLTGSYEDNIERVVQLVRQNEGVFEYLEDVEHLIIDEAQDIVGPRAELLMEIIAKLSKTCGVTVFADEAQAIYGFADDEESEDEPDRDPSTGAGHLASRIRAAQLPFEDMSLSQVHRAQTESLKRLFTEVRACVVAPVKGGTVNQLARITSMVTALAGAASATTDDLKALAPSVLDDAFVLFRRRADVLTAAAFWGAAPHRIRMSGLPVLIESWVGKVFWDFVAPAISREDFERRWSERVDRAADAASGAWDQLVRAAGESRTRVSIRRLRSVLARTAPPGEFLRPDFGLGGPVFGTIHGCKGREAQAVFLMLPAINRRASDLEEEARVVFVGATRAKADLRLGAGCRWLLPGTVPASGRTIAYKTGDKKPAAQVEIGRSGDVTAESVVGRRSFFSETDALAAQRWLREHDRELIEAECDDSVDPANGYPIRSNEGRQIARLSQSFNRDVETIGQMVCRRLKWHCTLRAVSVPKNLRLFGATTLVTGPDDPSADALYPPFSRSGFMLAPVVHGFSMMYFRY